MKDSILLHREIETVSYNTSAPISKKNTDFIKEMFVNILTSLNQWELEKRTIMSSIKNIDAQFIKSGLRLKSNIPGHVRQSILEQCVKTISFDISFHNRQFKIYLCMPVSYTKTTMTNIMRLVHSWFTFANPFVEDNRCSATVDIFLYLTNHKKILPTEEDIIIGVDHVNSAFTTGCDPHTEVNIFREEEWFRVLIHESFHNLGFDFSSMNPIVLERQQLDLKQVFLVNNVKEVRIYEAYCEGWAEILNVMFYTILNTHLPENPSSKVVLNVWVEKFHASIRREQLFSLSQCVKILKHNHLDYEDLFTEKAALFRENSNTFAYYILKCILIVHIDAFFDFCLNQNDVFSFHFKKKIGNLNSFNQFFLKHSRSDEMLSGIDTMKRQLMKTNRDFFRNTARMTLTEIMF